MKKQKKKILISESTKKVLEEEFDESFDELTEEELLQKVNESKKLAVTIGENGEIKVRQSLNG